MTAPVTASMRRRANFPEIAHETSDTTSPGDDIRKIHSEVLQIVNQRFLLTSGAVVFFASVAGWVTAAVLRPGSPAPGPGSGGSNVNFLPLAAIVLVSAVLYALFAYQASLTITLRWLTTYLMVTGSEWERDWYEFRSVVRTGRDSAPGEDVGIEMPFQAYSANPRVFRILIGVAFAYFSILHVLLWHDQLRDAMTAWRVDAASIAAAVSWKTVSITVAAPAGGVASLPVRQIFSVAPSPLIYWTLLFTWIAWTLQWMRYIDARCEVVPESRMYDAWTKVRAARRQRPPGDIPASIPVTSELVSDGRAPDAGRHAPGLDDQPR